MSLKKVSLLIVSLFLLTFTVSVEADTMLSLTGVNGKVDLTQHYYIDPYFGSLDGRAMNIYCVDPTHDSHLNTSWPVNVTSLANKDLTSTYLGIAGVTNALQRYEEAAWLLFMNQNPSFVGSDQAVIQAAVWAIIDPPNAGGLVPSASQGAVQNYVTLAQNSYNNGVDYSNIFILTDRNNVNQEFMINTPVPEPSTILLLGSGLLGLGVVGFRKKVKKMEMDLREMA